MNLSRTSKLLLGTLATASLAFGIFQLARPNEYEASALLWWTLQSFPTLTYTPQPAAASLPGLVG